MKDRTLLRDLLLDTLQTYTRGKSRLITRDTRYLELERFRSLPQLVERASHLDEFVSSFTKRRGFRMSRERIARMMLESLFLEYMRQYAPVERHENTLVTWVAPSDLQGMEDIVNQFEAYLCQGAQIVCVECSRIAPFHVVRPAGISLPRMELVDGVFLDGANSVRIECVGDSDEVSETVIREPMRKLEDLMFAVSTAFPGYVVFRPPVLTPGRAWQRPRLGSVAHDRNPILLEASSQYEMARRSADFMARRIATTCVRLPQDLNLLQSAYWRVTQALPLLDGKVRRTFLRAWRRRMAAAERQWEADRIVDYLIVLESLLVSSRDELKFRTSLYASLSLGRSAEQRESLYRTVSRAYDLRSDVVHGRSAQQVAEAADECERVCVGVLMRFLEWGIPANQVQEMLNKALVRGEGVLDSERHPPAGRDGREEEV